MWISAAVVEDTPHATGDIGLTFYGVRRDVPSALAADNNYMPPSFDSGGRMWVSADQVEKRLRETLFWLRERAEEEDESNEVHRELLKQIAKVLRADADGVTDCTNTNVTSSITSVPLFPANHRRKGATIFNDSTAVLYLSLKGAASTSNFNYWMAPGAHWELPFKHKLAIYGIWAAADGFARCGDLT